MVALSVAPYVKKLVLDIRATTIIQAVDFLLESLPLGLFTIRVVLEVRLVRTID
jgi:hypothetical protein